MTGMVAPLMLATLDATGPRGTIAAMRLTDHLAASRILYTRVVPTMPDILLIDVPQPHASDSLSLGRYYPVILETPAEMAELEAFLGVERSHLVPPDLLDRRPSALRPSSIVIARYAPPAPGWPWLLLCCWPPAYTAMVPSGGDFFAREAYTTEVFATHAQMLASERRLRSTLGGQDVQSVQNLPFGPGHA